MLRSVETGRRPHPPRQTFLHSHGKCLGWVLNHAALLAREVHGHQWVLGDASLQCIRHTQTRVSLTSDEASYKRRQHKSIQPPAMFGHSALSLISFRVSIFLPPARFPWFDFVAGRVVLQCHLVSEENHSFSGAADRWRRIRGFHTHFMPLSFHERRGSLRALKEIILLIGITLKLLTDHSYLIALYSP